MARDTNQPLLRVSAHLATNETPQIDDDDLDARSEPEPRNFAGARRLKWAMTQNNLASALASLVVAELSRRRVRRLPAR